MDLKTVQLYDEKAEEYARLVTSLDEPDQDLAAFIADLPTGGTVLDLGCGPGNSAALLARAGFQVTATDASSGMIELAARHEGVTARQATFDELDTEATYDGVFANFSLLHAARADLPRHLTAIKRALKPGGVFHIGMKTGDGAHRDTLERFYSYYSVAELEALLTEAGLTPYARREGEGRGLSGSVDPFVILRARA